MNSNLKYYLYLDDKVQGPHDLDIIRAMNLASDIQVCPEGSTEWIELKSLFDSSEESSTSLSTLESYMYDTTPGKIGKYAIIKEIGRGGMGSVYLASDEVLNRYVAVKELKIDEQKKKDPEAYNTLTRRFKKEAQVLAQLNHKNIVSIFDIIDENQNQYIIMEYLNGKNLEEYLKDIGKMEIPQAVSVVSDTCLALDYIHKKNIIHRDVKPSNIVILEDGVVKLTDFGVTRDMNSMTMTKDGSLVGTIAYASPEQDSKELDGRSDIFSLGVVLYELVTGKKPFTGDTIASVLLQIATKDPIKPSELNPQVHKMLENIIMKALSKSLGQRYPSAMDMYNELQSYKEALANNDTAVLNSVKKSQAFNPNVRVDSIPPGKMQVQDLLKNTTPPGAVPVASLVKPPPVSNIKQTPLPNTINTTNIHTQAPASMENLRNTNVMKAGMATSPGNQQLSSLLENNRPPTEEKKVAETEVITDNLPKEPETKPDKKNKKAKQISHVSEQMEKEKREAAKKIAIPAALIIMVLAAFITGRINFLDTLLAVSIISVSIYDFYAAKVSKWISYTIMFIGMFLVFFWLKTLMPSFANEKISSFIYYALDFALLILSFIGAFFILTGLDFLSIHKVKLLRPFGGFFKSLLTILSIIVIVSSTSFINTPFINKQFQESQIAGKMTKLLPEFKLGRRVDIIFGRFGLIVGEK